MLLSFDGKIQLLSLALNLIAADVPIGPKDRERFSDPLEGPGWAAVARMIVQLGCARGDIATAFEKVAGGGPPVRDGKLREIHDEACANALTLTRFATASSFIRAETFAWSGGEWGIGDPSAVAELNRTLAGYVERICDPCMMLDVVAGALGPFAVDPFVGALAARLRVVASAYRAAWLRRKFDAVLVGSGANGRWRSDERCVSAVERLVRDEFAYGERIRLARNASAQDRENRDAILMEKLAGYEAAGFDLSGLVLEDRRRLAAKAVFTRDGRLRLVVRREEVAAAAERGCGTGREPVDRVLAMNANAIDMASGACLGTLAHAREMEIAIAFNVDQLALNACACGEEGDRRAAADLEAAILATRRALLRLEGGARAEPVTEVA